MLNEFDAIALRDMEKRDQSSGESSGDDNDDTKQREKRNRSKQQYLMDRRYLNVRSGLPKLDSHICIRSSIQIQFLEFCSLRFSKLLKQYNGRTISKRKSDQMQKKLLAGMH